MLNTKFSPWPSFTDEEADAVASVLRSNKVNYWTGTETRSFETEFAEYFESKHALALANGTVALDVVLNFLVQPGDEVIVTPRSFIASISSVVGVGAVPVFADVDINTQNLSADTIEAVITPKTRAIVVVHLAGMPAEMDPIMALAEKHNLKVIEDCAQAHGARYKGRSVGSFGHASAWSFCQDKIMTTGGEGGMVTTNDTKLWKQMWAYKDHGKSWDATYKAEHPPGFRWLHESFGTNWRMSEMQAVLGRIQLKRMDQWQAQRESNARRIWAAASELTWLRVPEQTPDTVHAAYKAYVFIHPDQLPHGWTRDTIIDELMKMGIPAYSGSCSEVYLEKAFEGTGYAPEARLPNARLLGETSLMFLCHPTLKDSEIEQTCQALRDLDKRVMQLRAA